MLMDGTDKLDSLVAPEMLLLVTAFSEVAMKVQGKFWGAVRGSDCLAYVSSSGAFPAIQPCDKSRGLESPNLFTEVPGSRDQSQSLVL